MQQHSTFADRDAELAFLERKHAEPGAKLVVIYGRRRVGKTALIKRFMEGKRGAYILCTRDSMGENALELRRKFAALTGKEYFMSMATASLGELLRALAEEVGEWAGAGTGAEAATGTGANAGARAGKGSEGCAGRFVLAMDELPYLIELDPGVTSTLQKAWDEHLSKTGCMLILCGSSVGMMERDVMGAGSPLYGRRAGDWRLDPLQPGAVPLMFPGMSAEEAFKAWAIFGGTPFYLAQYDPAKGIEGSIEDRVLSKGEVLFNEPMVLLREEFREPRVYSLILKQISLGYRSLGELSQVTGLDRGNLSKYLGALEATKLIRHVLPLGQRKRGQYLIDDPFFLFWFRFAYPNMGDLELGMVGEVMERVRAGLGQHYGEMFHRMVMGMLKTGAIPAPFPLAEVGQWWHKGTEIDIVATGSGSGATAGAQLLFCECKWQENVDPVRLARDLMAKADAYAGRGSSRRSGGSSGRGSGGYGVGARAEAEAADFDAVADVSAGFGAFYYCLFARSFSHRPAIPNVTLFDMGDIGRLAFTGANGGAQAARGIAGA